MRILILLLISSNFAFAQGQIVSSFKGAQINSIIHLEFTIIAGQTCNGIVIERSTDSLNFLMIGEIAGVCGSIDDPVNYAFDDTSPIANADNFYRLAPGNAGWSEVIKVHFDDKANVDYLILPNPFNDYATISFQNPLNKNEQWIIYNAAGNFVNEGFARSNTFILMKNNLNPGLYILRLITDNKILKELKLIID